MLARSKAYLNLFRTILHLARNDDVEPATQQRLFNLLNDHDTLYGSLFDEGDTSVRSDNVESLHR